MPSSQPRRVYRFQRFNGATAGSLCHDQLHFADPGAFNDPLDCQPTVESDSDLDTLRKILFEMVSRRVRARAQASLTDARLKGDEADAYADRLGDQEARSQLANVAYNATDSYYEVSEAEVESWLLTNEIQRELLGRYDRGVCCFSAGFDNPLLWSHYGGQHRGLCVGYGTNRLPQPELRKVVYGGKRTISTSLIARALLEGDAAAQNSLDGEVLLRKASPWRYEREWRLLGNRGVQDSPLELTDVTFGLRCPQSLKYLVISALKARQGIRFFEMYQVRGTFELKRGEVDTAEMQTYFPNTAQSALEVFGPFIESAD